MPEGVSIRTASVDDLAEITRIGADSHAAPQWSAAQYQELLVGQPGVALRRTVLLGLREGEVAGFAVMAVLSSLAPPEAELENIAVAPNHRQHGVGSALMQAVIAWVVEQQAACLRLEVRAGNTPALRLYAAFGFLAAGTRPGYYANPVEDAIYLELTLPG